MTPADASEGRPRAGPGFADSHRTRRRRPGRGAARVRGWATRPPTSCWAAAHRRRGSTADIGAVYREIDPALIEPNPRQPRQVFDEEALAELVHSIREFGLMQPIVVRAWTDRGSAGRTALSARDGGAAVACGPGGRHDRHSGDRAGDRRGQPATRCPAGEHPPRAVEPTGRGGGIPAAARRVRRHPRRTGRPDRPVPAADHQHDPIAALADSRSAPGRGGRAVGRPRPGTAVPRGRPGSAGDLAARIVAEGLSVRATEEAVTLANRSDASQPARAAAQADPDARAPGCCRAALRRLRYPRHGQLGQAQRQDRDRVRFGGRPAAHRRPDELVEQPDQDTQPITSL